MSDRAHPYRAPRQPQPKTTNGHRNRVYFPTLPSFQHQRVQNNPVITGNPTRGPLGKNTGGPGEKEIAEVRSTTPSTAEQLFHLGVVLHKLYTSLNKYGQQKEATALLQTPFFLDAQCSYTVDKEKVFIKVYDSDAKSFFSTCVLEQVILHELAHVIDKDSVGHDDAFTETLKHITANRLDFEYCVIPPSYVCLRGATAPEHDPKEGYVPQNLIQYGGPIPDSRNGDQL